MLSLHFQGIYGIWVNFDNTNCSIVNKGLNCGITCDLKLSNFCKRFMFSYGVANAFILSGGT